jgi:hypothetical protein
MTPAKPDNKVKPIKLNQKPSKKLSVNGSSSSSPKKESGS